MSDLKVYCKNCGESPEDCLCNERIDNPVIQQGRKDDSLKLRYSLLPNARTRYYDAAIKVLKGIDRGHYDKIAAHVIRRTSTTDASVKQMTEYLDRVERYCYANDFMLTTPQELQWVRETEQGK